MPFQLGALEPERSRAHQTLKHQSSLKPDPKQQSLRTRATHIRNLSGGSASALHLQQELSKQKRVR
eukprot:5048624-Pyramimonas_sp.AAC.1